MMFNAADVGYKVHENRNYEADQVRHLSFYKHINASTSGQYGNRNFATLIASISAIFQGKKIYFIDVRQDTHFDLNSKPVSLKRIIPNDDNTRMSSDEVIAKERAAAVQYVGHLVKFIPKEPHGAGFEEFVTQASVVKDFIEHEQFEGKHTFYRFALSENGPLTQAQVEEFLSLAQKTEGAWVHTNSIVGDGSAILFIVLMDILRNASTDHLEAIVSRNQGAEELLKFKEDDVSFQDKTARAAFIQEFYRFAKDRAGTQLSWTYWKARAQ